MAAKSITKPVKDPKTKALPGPVISVTIFEAKTNLSKLVMKAQKGETVIITSGRAKTPVAVLTAVRPAGKKRLGALKTPGFALTKAFFGPLPARELALWNGDDE